MPLLASSPEPSSPSLAQGAFGRYRLAPIA